MKILKTSIKLLAVCVLLFVFVGAVLIVAPMLYNNGLLAQYERSVKKLPFDWVATEKRVGVLWGCGNHCDMQMIALGASDLEPIVFATNMNAHNHLIRPPFGSEEYGPTIFYVYGGKRFYIERQACVELDSNWEFRGVFEGSGFNLEFSERTLLERMMTANPSANYIVLYNDQTYSGFSTHDIRTW